MRRAASFQVSMMPSGVWLMIASSEEATTAASRSAVLSMVTMQSMASRIADVTERHIGLPKLDRTAR